MIGDCTYWCAKEYATIVSTGAQVISDTARATISIAQSAIETVGSPIRTAKNAGKFLFGITDFQAGWKAIHLHDQNLIQQAPNSFSQMIAVIRDQRSFSQRMGAFSGHMITGAAKMFTTTTAMSAYVIGTISNLISGRRNPTTLLGASELFSTAINNLISVSCSTLYCCATMVGGVTAATLRTIGAHPIRVTRITVLTGLIGGSLYVACSQGVKASDSHTILGKIGHTALSVAGIAGCIFLCSGNL